MPIPLRPDFDAPRVRTLSRRSKDAAQTRRLLSLAAIYEGASRTQASVIGGVTLQSVRDWVLKFNTHGPDGLIDRKAPGPTPRLSARFSLPHSAKAASWFYLPPYSPDLNSIKMAFAQLKTLLRKACERTWDAICNRIRETLRKFTPTECNNYCAHPGYEPN